MNSKLSIIVLLLVAQLSGADELKNIPQSGAGDTGFGVRTSAVGVDREKESITGFYHLINKSMPERSFHADCTIMFYGKLSSSFPLKIYVKNLNRPSSKSIDGQLFFDGTRIYSSSASAEQEYRIKLNQNLIGCSNDIDISSGEIQFNINKVGQWKRISAIRSARSYFYRTPDDSSVMKAFLVAGDLVFVYDEKPDWYYVKFQGRKTETVGWVKRSDAIELDQ